MGDKLRGASKQESRSLLGRSSERGLKRKTETADKRQKLRSQEETRKKSFKEDMINWGRENFGERTLTFQPLKINIQPNTKPVARPSKKYQMDQLNRVIKFPITKTFQEEMERVAKERLVKKQKEDLLKAEVAKKQQELRKNKREVLMEKYLLGRKVIAGKTVSPITPIKDPQRTPEVLPEPSPAIKPAKPSRASLNSAKSFNTKSQFKIRRSASANTAQMPSKVLLLPAKKQLTKATQNTALTVAAPASAYTQYLCTVDELKESNPGNLKEIKPITAKGISLKKERWGKIKDEIIAFYNRAQKSQKGSKEEKKVKIFKENEIKYQNTKVQKHISTQDNTVQKHISAQDKTVQKHISAQDNTVQKHISAQDKTVQKHIPARDNTVQKHISAQDNTVQKHISAQDNTVQKHIPAQDNTVQKHVDLPTSEEPEGKQLSTTAIQSDLKPSKAPQPTELLSQKLSSKTLTVSFSKNNVMTPFEKQEKSRTNGSRLEHIYTKGSRILEEMSKCLQKEKETPNEKKSDQDIIEINQDLALDVITETPEVHTVKPLDPKILKKTGLVKKSIGTTNNNCVKDLRRPKTSDPSKKQTQNNQRRAVSHLERPNTSDQSTNQTQNVKSNGVSKSKIPNTLNSATKQTQNNQDNAVSNFKRPNDPATNPVIKNERNLDSDKKRPETPGPVTNLTQMNEEGTIENPGTIHNNPAQESIGPDKDTHMTLSKQSISGKGSIKDVKRSNSPGVQDSQINSMVDSKRPNTADVANKSLQRVPKSTAKTDSTILGISVQSKQNNNARKQKPVASNQRNTEPNLNKSNALEKQQVPPINKSVNHKNQDTTSVKSTAKPLTIVKKLPNSEKPGHSKGESKATEEENHQLVPNQTNQKPKGNKTKIPVSITTNPKTPEKSSTEPEKEKANTLEKMQPDASDEKSKDSTNKPKPNTVSLTEKQKEPPLQNTTKNIQQPNQVDVNTKTQIPVLNLAQYKLLFNSTNTKPTEDSKSPDISINVVQKNPETNTIKAENPKIPGVTTNVGQTEGRDKEIKKEEKPTLVPDNKSTSAVVPVSVFDVSSASTAPKKPQIKDLVTSVRALPSQPTKERFFENPLLAPRDPTNLSSDVSGDMDFIEKNTLRAQELRQLVNEATRDHKIFCIFDNHWYIARPVRQELLQRGWLEVIPDRRMIPRRRPPPPGPVAKLEKVETSPVVNLNALLRAKDDFVEEKNSPLDEIFRHSAPQRKPSEENVREILSEFRIVPPNSTERKKTNLEIKEFAVAYKASKSAPTTPATEIKDATNKPEPTSVVSNNLKHITDLQNEKPGDPKHLLTDFYSGGKQKPQKWNRQDHDANTLSDSEAKAVSKIIQSNNSKINLMWLSIKPGIHLKCFNYSPEIINKFQKTTFCTKIGLWNHLSSLQWFGHEVHSPAKSPRMYNTGEPDDLQAFFMDYYLTACMGLLKWLAETFFDKGIKAVQSRKGKVPLRAVEFALRQCERFAKHREHEDLAFGDGGVVLHEEWNTFLQWFYMITNENGKIVEGSSAQLVVHYTRAVEVLRLMRKYWPEIESDGKLNMWIMKPYCASCGRGIFMTNNVHYIGQHSRYIVQKYIEKPFLVYNTKFDIRQWFMITKLLPLEIWMYKESYLRFCTQPFALRNLHESVHLSNNSVQRKYVSSRDQSLPEQNMWDSETFQEYLKQHGQPNIWDEVIYPGMRDAIISTLLASQDTFDAPRKSWFEVYGADFMLSQNLKEGPWLIEINENPAMDPSTKVTARLCPQMIRDTVKVIVDHRVNKNAQTGQWELIYRQNYSPSYGTVDLDLKGKQILRPGHSRLPKTVFANLTRP